ncbi:MAG: radical SAM protein [Lachnospiraceae bacterium]|nr:radical SAM protein [Lachnospiraceae bacterium]
MNEYLKNLNRLEFVITMACTGHCKHCSEGDHIEYSGHIDGDLAAKAIYDICRKYEIQSLMTFGGEPLLYPDVVCKIHGAAKKMGIPRRDLITNGYFSKDERRIKEVARMLAQSGVTYIMLSVDAFHQETIPLEPVKYFADCIKKEGIFIRTQPAWLVSEQDDNSYNEKTRSILQEFMQMGIEPADGNVIFPTGNAKKYLSEYFDDSKEYVNPYEEDPRNVHAISFEPDGTVLDGNINRDCMEDILNGYSVKDV